MRGAVVSKRLVSFAIFAGVLILICWPAWLGLLAPPTEQVVSSPTLPGGAGNLLVSLSPGGSEVRCPVEVLETRSGRLTVKVDATAAACAHWRSRGKAASTAQLNAL